MSFIAFPFSNVFISKIVLPETIPLHATILEIPYIILLPKLQRALPVRLIVNEIPEID
jgi:hypothetical protein